MYEKISEVIGADKDYADAPEGVTFGTSVKYAFERMAFMSAATASALEHGDWQTAFGALTDIHAGIDWLNQAIITAISNGYFANVPEGEPKMIDAGPFEIPDPEWVESVGRERFEEIVADFKAFTEGFVKEARVKVDALVQTFNDSSPERQAIYDFSRKAHEENEAQVNEEDMVDTEDISDFDAALAAEAASLGAES